MKSDRIDSQDEALIRIADSSALVRALSWPGRVVIQAWPESLASAATARWLSIPLDIRVRFVAIAIAVAVVAHVALTRFRAPQPTAAARAAWIALLVMSIAAAAGARTIAAAWREWGVRRTKARGGENA